MAYIIYEKIFGKIELFNKLKDEGKIVSTPYRGKASENSYCFNIGMKPTKTEGYKHRLLQTIKENFCITNSSFDEKFYQIINRAGQEWQRLNTVHSSSLLCLLCFYNINEQNPLNININGKTCRFTASEFEVQNKIGQNKQNKPYYSHIDVKLTGSCEGKRVALYLESKFSEYVNQRGSQKFTTTEEYRSIYSKLCRKIDGLDISLRDDKILLKQKDNKQPTQYWHGIKQMVSHYLGIKNCKDTDTDIIYLGEILYGFRPFNDKLSNYVCNYKKIYQQLVTALEEIEIAQPQKFKVERDILTYQSVFKDYNIDPRVREFYNLTSDAVKE